MRPLFVDFPNDEMCETIEDQFMFGSEILVAPVLYEGMRERQVYLPAGTEWLDIGTGRVVSGGQWVTTPAPLEALPLYLKSGSPLQGIFQH
jgi:alpha-D-xyloside xylohydrolase